MKRIQGGNIVPELTKSMLFFSLIVPLAEEVSMERPICYVETLSDEVTRHWRRRSGHIRPLLVPPPEEVVDQV